MSDEGVYVEFDTRRGNAPSSNRRTVVTWRRGYRGEPFSMEFGSEMSKAEQSRMAALIRRLLIVAAPTQGAGHE